MKLSIGTVQFGVDYGISNTKGQTALAEVKEILKLAKNHNITTLDTSPAYGNAEQALGATSVDKWQIITKTTAFTDTQSVINDFHQSLANLKQKSVYGLLIHHINDIYQTGFDNLYQALIKLKQQELVEKIGFSIYTPDQVDFLLANYDFDLIQVPINVFDQRLIQGGQLQVLKTKGVEVHARSIFLQGLLLAESKNNYFAPWDTQFKHYFLHLQNNNISKLQSALSFATSIKELDKIIIGVNNAHQLQEILSLKHIDMDYQNFSIDDERLLNPALWTL